MRSARGATVTADHLPEVIGRNNKLKDDRTLFVDHRHLNRLWLIDQRLGEVHDQVLDLLDRIVRVLFARGHVIHGDASST
ncbi:MAG: hypothetical protein R3A78_01915 [Polyangiales bacterium]